MNHHAAYELLCSRAEGIRSDPARWLEAISGGRSSERVEGADGEEYVLDMWLEGSAGPDRVIIGFSVVSPRDQKLDRLEERIAVEY